MQQHRHVPDNPFAQRLMHTQVMLQPTVTELEKILQT